MSLSGCTPQIDARSDVAPSRPTIVPKIWVHANFDRVVGRNYCLAMSRPGVERQGLANWPVGGPLLIATENVTGVTLVFGVLTRIGALIATGFALHLNIANIHRDDKWLREYVIEWMALISLALMRSGRFRSPDPLLVRRLP